MISFKAIFIHKYSILCRLTTKTYHIHRNIAFCRISLFMPFTYDVQKCKYAFKALAHLAKRYPDTHCQTAEIARVENIPRKFLELILLDLKKGDL